MQGAMHGNDDRWAEMYGWGLLGWAQGDGGAAVGAGVVKAQVRVRRWDERRAVLRPFNQHDGCLLYTSDAADE